MLPALDATLIYFKLPASVTSIGNWAFLNCTSLTNIIISEKVTSIGSGAFSSCWSLSSIIIPDGVKSIGDQAFSGCTKLTSITIPESVTIIGENAFYGCKSLTIYTSSNSKAWQYAKENKIKRKSLDPQKPSSILSLLERFFKRRK